MPRSEGHAGEASTVRVYCDLQTMLTPKHRERASNRSVFELEKLKPRMALTIWFVVVNITLDQLL